MKFSSFSIIIKNAKGSAVSFLLAGLLLFSASCSREKITIEVLPQINNGSFRVETDYPYYYIVYRYGKMKAANTINMRNQKAWEHNFTTEPGDTLLLEVHTITSNVQGSRIKADIMLDGKTIKAKETVNECIDGDCYLAQPLDLSLETVTK